MVANSNQFENSNKIEKSEFIWAGPPASPCSFAVPRQRHIAVSLDIAHARAALSPSQPPPRTRAPPPLLPSNFRST
jgi:hypothetical protein